MFSILVTELDIIMTMTGYSYDYDVDRTSKYYTLDIHVDKRRPGTRHNGRCETNETESQQSDPPG